LMASITGLLPDARGVVVDGSPALPRCLRTQSYCSHPLSGKFRSTAFHFGWPFFISQSMLSEIVLANFPTLSQSRWRKSQEISTDFTATVATAFASPAQV